MTNLVTHLKTFISEIQSHIENVTEKDGTLIIRMRPEVIEEPENLEAFMNLTNPLKKKLLLENYIRRVFKTKPISIEGINIELDSFEALEYHVDKKSLYVDQLKDFFQKHIAKDDIAECIAFLQKQGWTDKEFLAETGISKPTYYRYSNETKAKKAEISTSRDVPLEAKTLTEREVEEVHA